jgi:hypothetical protein
MASIGLALLYCIGLFICLCFSDVVLPYYAQRLANDDDDDDDDEEEKEEECSSAMVLCLDQACLYKDRNKEMAVREQLRRP